MLRGFTANIGICHVHSLAGWIPSYRLRESLSDHPELRDVGRPTIRQSLGCFRLALWDEESRRLVPFRVLRTRRRKRDRLGQKSPQALVGGWNDQGTLLAVEPERR